MSTSPIPTLYAALGGDESVHALVNRFYDLMGQDPTLAPLRALHAADLGPMREKLTDFLCAWLGGPQRYFQRPDAVSFGAAHAGFPIDAAMRDRWLRCMGQALDDTGVPPALQARIQPLLAQLAEYVRNR